MYGRKGKKKVIFRKVRRRNQRRFTFTTTDERNDVVRDVVQGKHRDKKVYSSKVPSEYNIVHSH